MSKVAIIGAGAAGMMAGIVLASKGHEPVIYEKNDKPGKKLFITGKGRCNLMNDCSDEVFFQNVVSNPKFMYSAFYGFDASMTKEFFEDLGLKIKTERGNRVFPVSDHSSDVISALTTKLKRLNVPIVYDTLVKSISVLEDEATQQEANKSKRVKGIIISTNNKKEEFVSYDKIIVATGGLSYPLTGSTGDGIRFARELGIKVVEPTPSLVPMCTEETWCKEIMGLALKNVSVTFFATVKNKVKQVYSDFGEMLFTHFGVSGPIILSASAYVGKYLDADLHCSIDLKPALTEEQLDDRLLRDFSFNMNKQFRNSLSELLPKNMIPILIELSGIDQYKKVNEISKEERKAFVHLIKNLVIHIQRFRGFEEAIITKGGVSVKEINPKTMECKSVQGLYFIGEVLDVDALTGGFNLQIAWSTANAVEV